MFVKSVLAGALAGLVATAPMSGAMELFHRRLPRRHRYPLPPREVTERMLGALGVAHRTGADQRSALTIAAHFGYGAAAGALYEALAEGLRPLRLPAALTGVAFGVVVWLVSYLGLLPLTGLFRPATDEPAPRNALMIGAHVVWGATLGLLTEALRGRPPSEAARRA